MAGDSSPCLSVYGLVSVKMANDLRGFGLDQPKQLSIAGVVRNWYKRLTWSIMVPTKSKIIVRDWIPVWKRLGSMQLDIMLRKESVAP